MRIPVLLALGVLALFFTACSSSGPEVRGRGPETAGVINAPTKTRWSSQLQVMTDKERTEFLDIDDDFEREMWLRRNGIDVRADLHAKLSRGISVDAAKRRISEPVDAETRDGRTVMLFFSRYNTESRTNFYLKFEGDQLVTWNSYTLAQQSREEELIEFEARLMRKFDTVLEKGMGPAAIRKQAENAQSDLNRVEVAHRESITDDFKGARKVSYSDYIIAEQLLYAKTRNELFAWFQGREPDKVIIHRPFENHLYYMTHKDIRGNETLITAEFVYESGQLAAWYVYHER